MNRREAVSILVAMVASLFIGLGTDAYGAEDGLAIKGYDPVAYFTESKPMPGDAQFRYEWDGAVYQFASAKHLELFKADPDRYLPQHRNLCTAAMSRGEKVIADPNNWTIHEGRLYLFGKPVGPGKLLADPAGVKARADANYDKVSQLPDPVQQ